MENIGRLLVRKDKLSGLYIPYSKKVLQHGIYDIREILGEIQLVYIGEPVMNPKRLDALSPNELFAERPRTMMTQKELDSINNIMDYF